MRDPAFGEQFRQRYARAEGQRLPLKVRRGDRTLDLQITVRLTPRVEQRLMIDSAAPAKAVRIRNGILKG